MVFGSLFNICDFGNNGFIYQEFFCWIDYYNIIFYLWMVFNKIFNDLYFMYFKVNNYLMIREQ